jgi:hypothetical protein
MVRSDVQYAAPDKDWLTPQLLLQDPLDGSAADRGEYREMPGPLTRH